MEETGGAEQQQQQTLASKRVGHSNSVSQNPAAQKGKNKGPNANLKDSNTQRIQASDYRQDIQINE